MKIYKTNFTYDEYTAHNLKPGKKITPALSALLKTALEHNPHAELITQYLNSRML
jgi:hypothetical protein